MIESIKTIRNLLTTHRQSHMNWLRYFTHNPEKEKEYMESAGGIVRQIQCITEYNKALEALTKIEEMCAPDGGR